MHLFLDSSALAKRYINEAGSARVEELLTSASALGVSVLGLSEVVSAFARRKRDGDLTPSRYAEAKAALLADIADATIIGITDDVVARAVSVLERWPLRGSDAVHIASAAEWSCDLFASADDRQLKAARALGLKTADVSKA